MLRRLSFRGAIVGGSTYFLFSGYAFTYLHAGESRYCVARVGVGVCLRLTQPLGGDYNFLRGSDLCLTIYGVSVFTSGV